MNKFLFLVLSTGLLSACTGVIGDSPDPGLEGGDRTPRGAGGSTPASLAAGRDLAAVVGVRRLSRTEFDATVFSLLGDVSGVGNQFLLAPDIRNLFDSAVDQQKQIGETLISQIERAASDIAFNFVNDPTRRDKIVGCNPSASGCLEQFVSRFGRLALRRPLSPEDKQTYLDIPRGAQTMGDPYKSVELIVSAFLQDPEFLNRLEIGKPVDGVPGLVKLDGWELASRLSYWLWGDTPSPDLLDHVEKGGLSTPEDVADRVSMMLSDPRAQGSVVRFHGLWLGYDGLANQYAASMKGETNELLRKVIFKERRPWQDIFRADETFVTYDLALNYGLSIPAGLKAGSSPTWVSYPVTSKRRGILSHGSLLSLGSKFGDTSPTLRGKEIRRRLFCKEIGKPTPELLAMFKVDVDRPPPTKGSPCKWDKYLALRKTSPVCEVCHNQMDLLGFGLENFDALGKYRTVDKDLTTGKPLNQCKIEGKGELWENGQRVDEFSGPRGLADLMTRSGALTECTLQQLYRFGMGLDRLASVDQQLIDGFATRIGTGDFRFDDVVRDLVSSPAFAHRRTIAGN